jgi:hypothetical protein
MSISPANLLPATQADPEMVPLAEQIPIENLTPHVYHEVTYVPERQKSASLLLISNNVEQPYNYLVWNSGRLAPDSETLAASTTAFVSKVSGSALISDVVPYKQAMQELPEAETLSERLGFKISKTVDSQTGNDIQVNQYPTLAHLNQELKALGYPDDGSLPRFVASDTGSYGSLEFFTALANGDVLVSTKPVEELHDMFAHVHNWLLMEPELFGMVKQIAAKLTAPTESSAAAEDQIQLRNDYMRSFDPVMTRFQVEMGQAKRAAAQRSGPAAKFAKIAPLKNLFAYRDDSGQDCNLLEDFYPNAGFGQPNERLPYKLVELFDKQLAQLRSFTGEDTADGADITEMPTDIAEQNRKGTAGRALGRLLRRNR